jgi:hypothetical protein
MPGSSSSNSETRGRCCDGLGSNIVVEYSVGPIITLHGRLTAREYTHKLDDRVYPIIQMLFPNNDAVFQDDNAPIHTAGTVVILKSMKMNFNMFPSQHNHQV